MQFLADGPDIPDALLQAHEEGRVVFFCGAGISYPAGMPGFGGLVQEIYRFNGTAPTDSDIEHEAFKRGQFDATLALLERRLPGQRLAVRYALAKVLKPNLRRKGATDTQAALLRLARNREGALRLVTTNFDRLFHVAAKRTGQKFQAHAAPMLPIPKNSRWDGLVYLHGLLPEKLNDAALNRLVVTSGDFGLAYLTERWAARFVSELFRNYVVCFVGYSIDDPVLRYMMDALAADRMQGEVTPQAWALGGCEVGQEHLETVKWKAKGVTPVLYDNRNKHSALHQTLHAWAETYRDGVQGKEAIVVKHALTRPQESTQQDDFVGRMLWALSDISGLPAKRFADFNPAPSLDWLLEAFTQERFGHGDLSRFGVPPRDEVDTNLRFSLVRRPATYGCAPLMVLASGRVTGSNWDEVMFHLARWLMRHLDDPRLIIWIAERGGQLHDGWRSMIERELDRFASLRREGKTSELNEIRLHAPKAIPSPLMHILWRQLLGGRVKSTKQGADFYEWKRCLHHEGLTATLRLELRELLAPKITIREPFRWSAYTANSAEESTQIEQLVECEVELAVDHVYAAIRDLADEHWTQALPLLLDDLQHLLCDALDLLRELGKADDDTDRSHWDLPSITPHRRNLVSHEWVTLIELLRDAWLATRAIDSARAIRIAHNWFELPYPTFKRLALFAASHDDCIQPNVWVDWLLLDGAKWLWSIDTQREMFRLLVLQGRHLVATPKDKLEAAILEGPRRESNPDDIEEAVWQELFAGSVWLRLAKLNLSGLALGVDAAKHLARLSKANPQRKLATNELDEFSHWITGTGDPDYEDSRDVDIAPRKRRELAQWLSKSAPEQIPFYRDTWREVCRTRFFHSLAALCDLARDGVWPISRWREAMQAWAEEGMVLRSWRYAAPLVQAMPDSVLLKIDRSVTWWMESASKSINRHEDILLDLCSRLLALPQEVGLGSHIIRNGIEIHDPVSSAINHPIGHVTQTLINLWFKHNPNDNDLLPPNLKPVFTSLCDVNVDRFRHGRVLLGSRLIAFFRVDRPWTEQYLLPFFDWNNSGEARAVWEGFLWSPRLYQPLLVAFKSEFLDCANHYTDLGEHQQQFAALLTYAALGPTEGYTMEDFRLAISKLPPAGLVEAAQAFYQAVASSGGQREEFWRNRAQPFWRKVWPKSGELATPKIAEFLTLMAISVGDEFAAAFAEIKDWVKPFAHPYTVIHALQQSKLCTRFPDDALALLSLVLVGQQWGHKDVVHCLKEIAETAPKLVLDPRYVRLRDYSSKHRV